MTSTSARYGAIAITFHWLGAGFAITLLASGFRVATLGEPMAKATLLWVHVLLGLSILALTLLRFLWWVFVGRRPAPVAGTSSAQRKAARVIHVLFYVVTLGMVASGIGMIVLSGAGGAIFDSTGETLPSFRDVLPREPHGLGARLMLALLILHVLAALWHHFVRRDGVLRRMWYASGR